MIDTNIFLNVLRDEEPYSASSSAILTDVEAGKVIGLASTITLAEILVGSYKAGATPIKKINLALGKLESSGLRFIPVDKAIANRGAEIRAAYGLKLPDALIAGTALLSSANALVSRDKKAYAMIEDLKVTTPEEMGYR